MQTCSCGHADIFIRRKAGTKTKILPKAGTSILEYFFSNFHRKSLKLVKTHFGQSQVTWEPDTISFDRNFGEKLLANQQKTC